MTRHFRTLLDLGPDGLDDVLQRADTLKRLRGTPEHPSPLKNKHIGILLEKASTRTRISFEVGITELGGHVVVLGANDLQLGRGESVEDTARVLSRYLHAVVFRAHGHERVEALASSASIPVINGLSDKFHPCQLLADLQTVREATGGVLRDVVVAWVGDGNNMAHSWIHAAALTGLHLRLACPIDYAPASDVIEMARAKAHVHIELCSSVDEAVRSADVLTTDVWASMGQESEAQQRKKAFQGYRIGKEQLSLASANAIFLHCLPAHRGEEVDAEVIDGDQSRVWDEVENRLHAQKALLEHLFSD